MTVRGKVAKIFSFLADEQTKNPQPTGLDVYAPHPSDVVVTTFPKAGTTLMQQMTYQVVVHSGGAPKHDPTGENFSDICDVAPWLDFIPQFGRQFASPSPRVFKTHESIARFNVNKQRHIVVIRDPLKFPGSWLDFTFDNYPIDHMRMTDPAVMRAVFDETVLRDLLGVPPEVKDAKTVISTCNYVTNEALTCGWFEHTKGWVNVLNDRNVLILFYEDVTKNMELTIRRIASFLGRSLTEEQVKNVASRCTRQYMSADNRFKSLWDAQVFGNVGLSSKVKPEDRDGFTKYKLKAEHLELFRIKMLNVFGVESYADLKKIVNAKQSQVHM